MTGWWQRRSVVVDPPPRVTLESRLYSAELETVTLRAMIEGLLAHIGALRSELAALRSESTSLRGELLALRTAPNPTAAVGPQIDQLIEALAAATGAVESLRRRIDTPTATPAPEVAAPAAAEAQRAPTRPVLADVREIDRIGAAADRVATIAAVLRG